MVVGQPSGSETTHINSLQQLYQFIRLWQKPQIMDKDDNEGDDEEEGNDEEEEGEEDDDEEASG